MKKFTSSVLPPEYVQRLIDAADFGNLIKINEITDELAKRGICRPRDDVSMFACNRKARRV